MIDPIGLAELAVRAADWARKVADERRSKSDRRAANLLRDAGVLTAAVQALVNDTYSLIGALGRFDTEWTGEQRQALYDRVSLYMVRHDTIPYIYRSVAALETWRPSELDDVAAGDGREAVGDLIRWGTLIAERDHYSKATYFVLGDLPSFWARLKDAHSIEDLDWLASWARSIDRSPEPNADSAVPDPSQDPTASDRLRLINEAFGRLSAEILRKHPAIPPPSWTHYVATGEVTSSASAV